MSGVHCKSPAHLQVSVGNNSGTLTRLGEIKPEYRAALGCTYPDAYDGPGILLATLARPDQGLHLLPESVTWLPGELRQNAMAAGSNGVVRVAHTVQGEYVLWRSFTSGAAIHLADRIDAVWKAHTT